MNYCEHCGAANDIMNEQCYRCGGVLAQAETPLVPATGPAIGEDFELPDWLKKAAQDTPAAPPVSPSPARNLPPVGFHVAGLSGGPTTDDLFRREPERPAAPPPPAPKPLPPVPTAGLPNAMPDWLRQQAAAKPPVPAPTPEATDTSTFISETDLPDWIRQIAEADAAKKVEQDRLAAEAANKVEPAAPKRIPLPGEASPSAPAANPWLSRRDSADAAASWGAAAPTAVPAPAPAAPEPVAAAEPDTGVDYGEPPASAPASPAKTKRGLKIAKPSIPTPTLPKASLPKASLPKASLPKASMPKISMPSLKKEGGSSESSPQTMRLALIAALVVLLLIVLVMSVL